MKLSKNILFGSVDVEAEKKVLGAAITPKEKLKSQTKTVGPKSEPLPKSKAKFPTPTPKQKPEPKADKKKTNVDDSKVKKAKINQLNPVQEKIDKFEAIKIDLQSKIESPDIQKTVQARLNESTKNIKTEKAASTLSNVSQMVNSNQAHSSQINKMRQDLNKFSSTVAESLKKLEDKGNLPQPKDNYEERVTITPQNLIFYNRSNKMSAYPKWM
jgi:hypothetical protein